MTQHPQCVALKPRLSTLDLDCECLLPVNIGYITDRDVIANMLSLYVIHIMYALGAPVHQVYTYVCTATATAHFLSISVV